MSESSVSVEHSKPRRPVGVWLLTLYAIIFAGIAPLVLTAFLLFSGQYSDLFGNTAINLAFTLTLNLGIIAFAIGAWQGKNTARVIFVVLVSINYLLIGLNNLLLLTSGRVPSAEESRLLGRVLRGVLFPALYIWYFNRKSTKEFYVQSKSSLPDAHSTL